jgi:hypothetical protein
MRVSHQAGHDRVQSRVRRLAEPIHHGLGDIVVLELGHNA